MTQSRGYSIGPLDIKDGDIVLVPEVDGCRMLIRDIGTDKADAGRVIKAVFLEGPRQGATSRVHIPWSAGVIRFDAL